MSEGDYITLYDEVIDTNQPLLMFHPVHTMKRKSVKSFEPKALLQMYLSTGKLCIIHRQYLTCRKTATAVSIKFGRKRNVS